MTASERPAPVFIDSPPRLPMTSFRDAEAAIDRLIEIYDRNTAFLRSSFEAVVQGAVPEGRIRAYYPLIRVATDTHGRADSRLSYGQFNGPGVYETTVSRPELFRTYLVDQLEVILRNYDAPIEIGESSLPIPLHFAFFEGAYV